MEPFEYCKSILDCIGDPVFIVDREYRFVFVNNALCEQSGIPSERWLGKTQYDLFPREQADVLRARAAYVFETGKKNISEEQATDGYGSIRTIETTKTLYIDATGERYVVGAMRDITERKRTEEALQESEKRYRMLTDNATDVIYVHGLDLRYKYVSPSVTRVRGFHPEELIGSPIARFMKPESVESVKRLFREELELDGMKTADPNRTRVMELEMLCKDGSTMWAEIKGSFLRNDQGDPIEIMGIARDITERKQAEEALRDSEARFRDLVEMLPEIVFELDTDGRIIYANQRMFDLLGYSSEDIKLKPSGLKIIAPEDRQRCIERFTKRTQGEKMGAEEYTALRKDGSTFPALFHLTRKTKDGELTGFRGIIIDIAQHKGAEEEKKLSEKLSAALEMAGTICHEFNQPLQAIIGYTELLSEISEDSRINDITKKITGQIHRMGAITKRLMGLEKYSSRDYVGSIRITDVDPIDEGGQR
ncbi:MAG TPA: PAS domain S-box protein [Syntrophorhabdaceae bacterium]|nr:PAS domain S-box protein [Syntrophorhabdaceae bacterium]